MPNAVGLTALLAIAMCQVASCARIEIVQSDGQVKIERQFGVVSIALEPGSAAQMISSSGLGVMSNGRELVVGYFDSNLAFLGTDCRVVLWIEEEKHLTAAYDLFGGEKDICVLSARNMEKPK